MLGRASRLAPALLGRSRQQLNDPLGACASEPKLLASGSALIDFLPQAGYAKGSGNQKHNTHLLTQQQGRESKNVALNGDSKEAWTAVLDKPTGGVYWWNQQTGQTTAVGSPKPGAMRPGFTAVGRRVPAGRALLSMAAMGAGMGLVFGILGKLF